MATYVQDILGIPTEARQDLRPIVAEEYLRSVDQIEPAFRFSKDLVTARGLEGPGAIVGLVSVRIKSGWQGFRWIGAAHSLVPSEPWDVAYSRQGVSEQLLGVVGMREFQAMVVKYAALGVMPKGKSLTECAGKCALRKRRHWHPTSVERGVGPACLKRLHRGRPDWPKGAAIRAPVRAGPAQPAVPNATRRILLLGLGGTSEQMHLGSVAQAVEASTGLSVEISVYPDMPRFPSVEKGWYAYTDVLAWVADQGEATDWAAICVVVNHSVVWDKQTLRSWQMWTPGQDGVPETVKCPVIGVSLFHGNAVNWALPRSIRQLERVLLPVDGRDQIIEVPQYGKLLVGALALSAREDQQCWTFGCPSTVWEDIGLPHRSSYWLCEPCQRALRAIYANGEVGVGTGKPK